MTSKAIVVFNIILMSVVVILATVLRLQRSSLERETKILLGQPTRSLKFTELSQQYRYPSEEHNVITEDGYILTIFRMNGRKCGDKLKRPPVILMHGLYQSSDAWLDAGPDAGLAYLISDACYDLWVGNQRGNYYSRRHVHLNPDKDPEFWHFSVDEIGYYDIPATIDYVLQYTQEEKLNYIGFSHGASAFLIMCSERPGYCDKANVLIGLAPPTRLAHLKSVAVKFIFESMRQLEGVLASAGINEVFTKGSLELLGFMCQFSAISESICATSLSLIDSYHPGSMSNETLIRLFEHFPAGTSVHTLARYGQALKSKRFEKFDYGAVKNMKLYGQEQPLSYNLSAVTVPFVTLYGNNDHLIGTKDVLWLVKQLPNVLEAVAVSDPLWNHLDVTYSQFTKELIFPKISEYLLKYSQG